MRTGVLADENALKIFAPHSQEFHDTHLAKPHLHKHGMQFKKGRSDRYKPPARPRAPYMALYEYAQLLNPLNPTPFVESFGERLDAVATYQPPKSFQGVVAKFDADNPSYSTERGIKRETAYFIQQLIDIGYQIAPDDIFLTGHGNISRTKVNRPLHSLYERLHTESIVDGDTDMIYQMNNIYEDAMEAIIPNRSMGSGLTSKNTSRPPSREASPSRSPSPGRVQTNTFGRRPRNPSPVVEEDD